MYASFLQKTFLVLAGNAFSKALLLGFEVVFALLWGPGHYGLFALGLVTLLALSNLSVAGLGFAIVRQLAIDLEEASEASCRASVQASLVSVAGLGAVVGLILFWRADLIATQIFGKPDAASALKMAGLLVPLEACNVLMGACFRGFRQFARHVLTTDLIRNLALALSIPIMLVVGFSLERVFLCMLVGTTTATAFGLFNLGRMGQFKRLERRQWGAAWMRLIRFSYLIIVWSVIEQLAARAPVLLGGVFLAREELGILSLLTRSLLLFTFFQTGLSQTASVEFARLYHLGKLSALRRGYRNIAKTLALISTLVAIPILLSPGHLMTYFGGQYGVYGYLVVPLVLAQFLTVGSGPVGHLLINCSQQRAVFFISILGSTIQVGLGYWLMSRFQLEGAVAALVATMLVLLLLRQTASQRLLSVNGFTAALPILLLISLVSVMVGRAVVSPIASPATFAMGLAVAYLSGLALIAAYCLFDESMRRNALSLARILGKRLAPTRT